MTNEIVGWEAACRKRSSGTYGKDRPHQDAESLERFFRIHNVQWILDLGCGDGRHLVYFAKRGYEMNGIVHLHQDRRDYTCMLAQKPHSILVEDGILKTQLSHVFPRVSEMRRTI